jgi:hypothetical protein
MILEYLVRCIKDSKVNMARWIEKARKKKEKEKERA